jgi:hypothetical protein
VFRSSSGRAVRLPSAHRHHRSVLEAPGVPGQGQSLPVPRPLTAEIAGRRVPVWAGVPQARPDGGPPRHGRARVCGSAGGRRDKGRFPDHHSRKPSTQQGGPPRDDRPSLSTGQLTLKSYQCS